MVSIDEWSDPLDLLNSLPDTPLRPPLPHKGDRARRGTVPPELDAEHVFVALRPFGQKGVTVVECYRDEDYPWIEIRFDETRIVEPPDALAIGAAIHRALRLPVLFHALRPYAVIYLIGEPLRRGGGTPLLPPDHYGVPLEKLQQAWAAYAPLSDVSVEEEHS